ncbi:hypothetical protein AGMMS4952_27560 [Spirochaetia bacterium]|nr:hypothetical protein AGMMS4952_27560 [Spirochaetia bacterium]
MKNRGVFKFAACVTLLWALVLPGCEQVVTSPRSFFENLVEEPTVPGPTDPSDPTEPSEPVPDDNTPAAPSLPKVSASDGLITVSWSAVEGAVSYEVYYSDTQTAPGTPAKIPVSTVAVIDGLTNKTTYYVWVKAVNTFGVSALSPMAHGTPWPASEAPDTPGALTVIPGINRLTLNWAPVGGASSYDVYINTTPSSGSAGLSATVTGTTAVIGSLTNETIYYFWIKARNANGASGFSPMEVGTPTAPTSAPTAPGAPVVSPGNKQLTVSWAAVEMAMAYEVWVGTSNNSASASKHGGDVSEGELSTIITGLNNGTAYYVWVKAKNTIGASGFSPAAIGTPSAFAAKPEEPGTPY